MLNHWSPALTGSVTTKKDRCAEVEECRDNIYDAVVVEEADGQLSFGVAGDHQLPGSGGSGLNIQTATLPPTLA
jgi:hypothetical protein